MTVVLNDPSLWPLANWFRFYSYFVVASAAAVVYDWALTFGQEVELIWRKRWSLVTLLYISVRYAAIPYIVFDMLSSLPTISTTDAGCRIAYLATCWIYVVVNTMVGAIMIARLHAMYQRSRKMLVFLIVILLSVSTACGVIAARDTSYTLGEELILSGTYACMHAAITGSDIEVIDTVFSALYPIWQLFALLLTAWIGVKHLRDLQRSSTGWTIGRWFTLLLKTHTSYAVISCFVLGSLSPTLADSTPGAQTYLAFLEFFSILQMFVLGPRLILSIREYYAKLLDNNGAGTDMTTIAFQEHVHVSTGGSV